jgi:hypothetical protein
MNPPVKIRKIYSTANANPIGVMDPVGDLGSITKRQKNIPGTSSRVRFDSVEPNGKSNPAPTPAPIPTRRSTRSAKANSKKDVGELFGQLAKGFQLISKTFEEIAETIQ